MSFIKRHLQLKDLEICVFLFTGKDMDNPRIGSLNSLADYGLGESDIEDSDDEAQDEDSRVKLIAARPASIPAAQARVKTSKFCQVLVGNSHAKECYQHSF